MSSSESLFIGRHLGMIIGEKVPRHDETWKLWKMLREMISILTSTNITETNLTILEALTSEHHKLFKKEFGTLRTNQLKSMM